MRNTIQNKRSCQRCKYQGWGTPSSNLEISCLFCSPKAKDACFSLLSGNVSLTHHPNLDYQQPPAKKWVADSKAVPFHSLNFPRQRASFWDSIFDPERDKHTYTNFFFMWPSYSRGNIYFNKTELMCFHEKKRKSHGNPDPYALSG